MLPPDCGCFPNSIEFEEPVPYYDQLGSGRLISDLREHFEKKWCLSRKQIRFEKIKYTKNRGLNPNGCPTANWILRREELEERCLILVKKREKHFCLHTWIVVAIVIWEGISKTVAYDLYDSFVDNIGQFSPPIPRECEFNQSETCACQGTNLEICGVSYSVGCSFNLDFDTCKFATSEDPDKFSQLNEEEPVIEEKIQTLATNLAPMFQFVAPIPYQNQIELEDDELECRLGNKPGRPWSCATVCIDFSIHPHTDVDDLENGCSTVVSLIKHRGLDIPDDEQLYVLPHYTLDDTDEFGNQRRQQEKVVNKNIAIVGEPLMPKKITFNSETSETSDTLTAQSCQPLSGDLPSSIIYEFEYDPTLVQEPLFELVSNTSEILEGDNNCSGGVGISLSHGSLLFQCSQNEVHATTALKNPDRFDPNTICLVFHQHKNLNFRHHGREEVEKRMEKCDEETVLIEAKMKEANNHLSKLLEELNRRKQNSLESQMGETKATSNDKPNSSESKIGETKKLISILRPRNNAGGREHAESRVMVPPRSTGDTVIPAKYPIHGKCIPRRVTGMPRCVVKDKLKAHINKRLDSKILKTNNKKPNSSENKSGKADDKLVSIIKTDLKATNNCKKTNSLENESSKTNTPKLVSILKEELKATNNKRSGRLKKPLLYRVKELKFC